MTFAPRFSPDGTQGGAEPHRERRHESTRSICAAASWRRLTSGSAIDTAPSYSPDGSQIVFNSDRGGSQQLYVMNADGSDASRISFGAGKYGTPVWSPRGDLIAFTKIEGGIVLYRRDAAGRFRRASADTGLSRRRPDLGTERSRA